MALPTELNAAQKKKLAFFQEWGIEIGPKQEELILALGPKRAVDKVKPANAANATKITREVEGVLRSLHIPNTVLTRTCPTCKQRFQTNYMSESYCSDECRTRFLLSIGITFDRNKTEAERWFPTEPPTTIPPLVYIQLVKYAHHILEMPLPLSVRRLLFTIEQREKEMTITVADDNVTVAIEPEEAAIIENQKLIEAEQPSQNTQSVLDRLAFLLG